jgi:dTDP-glucose 4,6-dehydratase
VVAADNLLTGRLSNLEHLRNDSRFEFLQQDVCSPIECGAVDYVFHFASPASPVDYAAHGIETLRVGSYGTFEALELARRHGAKFMMASTSECYGDPLEHPQTESYWGHVNPIGPRSVYVKPAFLRATMTITATTSDTRFVRIFNTTGRACRSTTVRDSELHVAGAARENLRLWRGRGAQFCYVSDGVDGIRLSRSSEHEPVNIGTY